MSICIISKYDELKTFGQELFLEKGGPVLNAIMVITFLMWMLIVERFIYFRSFHQSVVNDAITKLSTNLIVAAWSWGAYMGQEALDSGIKVKTSSLSRHHVNSTMTKAKANGNYMNSILAHQEATNDGYDEALLLDIQGFIADSYIDIQAARLMTIHCAEVMDKEGDARVDISAIKVFVPEAGTRVVDRAIQMHGWRGVSSDTPLAGMYQGFRTLRLADGPDEVHRILIAKEILKKYHDGLSWDFGV